VWWYQWGTNGEDPDVVPAACLPDPDDETYCDDGMTSSVGPLPGTEPADNPEPLVRAYIQKDSNNVWQAGSVDWSAAPVNVHWIDWGDNLESVPWYTRSQVRTEVVLFQELDPEFPMTEYEMRHVDGWGIDEVHGAAATTDSVTAIEGPGTQATIYSHCARLTIQKLLVPRDDARLVDLVWVPGEGWTEPDEYPDDLINPHIFNGSVHEGGDGPGYYSAEINVKGRIIYGYTWSVRLLNDVTGEHPDETAAGDYRITFSFDAVCGEEEPYLNTFFTEGVTQILQPAEEVVAMIASDTGDETGSGGTGVLDFANNLTYMDVQILERDGGGNGGGGNGGNGGNPN
ncbi:MAG: hypothetical protein JSU96_06810, partial [Acidobacteriota bacterium]